MGGCCCCPSRGAELNEAPVYFYALGEHGSLSSVHGTTPVIPTALLVDTNLETSVPDTYRAPPAPLPYDVDLGCQQNLPGSLATDGNKVDTAPAEDSKSTGETGNGLVACENLKDSDCKSQTDSVPGTPKLSDVEPEKLKEPVVSAKIEEDVCPTCLEEYDLENPRIITKCNHNFHLACILEWMERSDTCPICDQEMVFDHNFEK
ncbi:putative E3 ubiquitin-protein ligase RHB1A [Tasmannia lanceolata]|uniref:putative E3 ubiquitin-protein ligase RHB1A n=1 Tax=Tasmannia lanceolata TaxID=3420 RepID=UPI004062D942